MKYCDNAVNEFPIFIERHRAVRYRSPSVNAFIVGAWDGTHIWTQWDAQFADEYEVQYACRRTGARQWENWREPFVVRESWHVFNPHRRGVQVLARVRRARQGGWSEAKEAIFGKSKCLFEFASRDRTLYYREGAAFTCYVDGAACCYHLTRELEVPQGESRKVWMEAAAASGWSQLDRPSHFSIRPSLGVVIRNVSLSENDLLPLTRGFTELAVRQGGPVTMALLEKAEVR
jgi:hypothetical protein